jgi:peptidoglycan/LPS O-acetylase OafA/YrhL
MRAFSAQIVLVGHALAIFSLAPELGEPNSPYMQEIGVVAFFILSGFVITHTTRIKMKSPTVRYHFATFLRDRFSRIYSVYFPALFVVLGLTMLYNTLKGVDLFLSVGPDQFLGNLFMLQSHPLFRAGIFSQVIGDPFVHVTSLGLGRPFWSIAVEWWLYIAFGAIYFAVIQWRKSTLLKRLAMAGFIAVTLVVPAYQSLGQHRALILAWGLGAATSFVLSTFEGLAKRFAAVFWICGIALTFAAPLYLYVTHAGAYSMLFTVGLGAGVLFLLAALQNLGSSRFSVVASGWADFSYSCTRFTTRSLS